jgi:hypothetical protein
MAYYGDDIANSKVGWGYATKFLAPPQFASCGKSDIHYFVLCTPQNIEICKLPFKKNSTLFITLNGAEFLTTFQKRRPQSKLRAFP